MLMESIGKQVFTNGEFCPFSRLRFSLRSLLIQFFL